MADRKINLKDLSEQVGIANVNLSKIKTGKVSAIRFSTLNAICKALDCQPGDILEYVDRIEIGNGNSPAFTFGGNIGISWKGFDFSMTWSGATKVSRLLDDIFREPFGATDSRSLMKYMIDDMWTPEKGNSAKAPAISFTNKVNNYRDSDLWLRDASYLRLKNVEIGYNFPKKILSKINIGSLRVFATGYNLLTLDKLKIVDPESRPNGNAMYPVVMVINMGLKVGF